MYECTPKMTVISLLILVYIVRSTGADLKTVKCATDSEQIPARASVVPNSRFGWLGVIQHAFYIAKKTEYAITPGVLIHPGFALASAEDIGKIPVEQFATETKFIVWGKDGLKHIVDVYDYYLHPDYNAKLTVATVALVRLHKWVVARSAAPVDPICLPIRGTGNFNSIQVVKLTDASKEVQKEILPVNYVENRQCNEFYFRAGLSLKNMAPLHQLCTAQREISNICVWDAGSLLITRLNNVHWTLLGFGIRGPGCAAPARFVMTHRLLQWLDDTITMGPVETRRQGGNRMKKIAVRQFSPYKMVLYDADTQMPVHYGQCDRRTRGSLQFKEEQTLISTGSFGMGFYFLEIHTIAMFTCARVTMKVAARTEAAVWVEHNCVRQQTGMAPGITSGPQNERETCYVYYQTTAYVEIRFRFAGYANMVLILYGYVIKSVSIDPWPAQSTTTDNWRPTRKPLTIQPFYVFPWFWNAMY